MARPKSDIQERILAAARARFLAEGVEACSLRNIAKDAETSIGMVYYYYPSKDDIFLAIVEECYQNFLADLEQVIGAHGEYQARMCGFYRRLGAMTEAEREIIHLVIRESLTSNDRRDRLRARFLRGHLPLLYRAILQGFETGELDESLNPIVAFGCSLALGGVAVAISKFACCGKQAVSNDTSICDTVRESIGKVLPQLPTNEDLAELLSQIAVRALGKR